MVTGLPGDELLGAALPDGEPLTGALPDVAEPGPGADDDAEVLDPEAAAVLVAVVPAELVLAVLLLLQPAAKLAAANMAITTPVRLNVIGTPFRGHVRGIVARCVPDG